MNDNNLVNDMNETEMIERYIYEVIKRVPQKQRKEIKLELAELIEDMKEEGTTEEILMKLGNPAEFAKRYRDENNYVIGPDYYDDYVWIAKIGAFAVAISAIVSAVVRGLTEAEGLKDFIKVFIGEGIGVSVSGAVGFLGMLTIIFVLMERLKIKVDIKPDKEWTPSQLPAVPEKKAMLSRGESIVAIIFYMVLMGMFLFVPEIFGAFETTDTGIKSISCVFNLEQWSSIVPFFVLILVIGMFDEIVKIIYGQYCKAVMYSSIVCNAISVVLFFILFKCMDVWNSSFADELLIQAGKKEYSKGDMLRYWNTDRFDEFLLGFIVLASCLEIASYVYHTYKYGRKDK